jgi:hypothetical protein
VDAAPKKIAASLGFAFSLGAGLSFLFNAPILAIGILAVLLFCALLESVFSVCLGMHCVQLVSKSVLKIPF